MKISGTVLLFGIVALSLIECFVTAEEKEAAEGKGYQQLQGDASRGRLERGEELPAENGKKFLRRSKEAAEGGLVANNGLAERREESGSRRSTKGGLWGYDAPAERREESLRRLASLCMQLGGLKNSKEELFFKKKKR